MNSINSSDSSCVSFVDSADSGVLIMDACPITALGIKRVLTQTCGITEPINYVRNLASISPIVASAPPALLVMDICGEKELMLDGLRLLAHLYESHPALKIIICTDFRDPRVLALLALSNARGILLKHEPVLALAQCVSEVVSGGRQWLSPKTKQLLSKTTQTNSPLTARELDVLVHLFSGYLDGKSWPRCLSLRSNHNLFCTQKMAGAFPASKQGAAA